MLHDARHTTGKTAALPHDLTRGAARALLRVTMTSTTMASACCASATGVTAHVILSIETFSMRDSSLVSDCSEYTSTSGYHHASRPCGTACGPPREQHECRRHDGASGAPCPCTRRDACPTGARGCTRRRHPSSSRGTCPWCKSGSSCAAPGNTSFHSRGA